MKQPLLVGKTALLVVDVVQDDPDDTSIPMMSGYAQFLENCATAINSARANDVPVIYVSEQHRRSGIDFGRELDGNEDVHLLEGDATTELSDVVAPRPDEPIVIKRRYSSFFATDLELVLKGLSIDTLVIIGCLTDVCVHYTFVDAHQNNYFARVVTECTIGSAQAPHDASLAAMEYLQTGAIRSLEEVTAGFAQSNAA